MSHYTVLVPAEDEEELYERLIPYYEYGCSKENDAELERRGLLVFRSVEAEYREEYENDSVTMVKMPDGRLLYRWDDEFRKPGTFGTGTDTHEVPAHLKIVQVPHKERYATFGEFVEDWAGYTFSEEHKTWGYHKGTNEKWDWYAVGGRYTGRLHLKDGANGESGMPGLMTEHNTDPTRADAALVGDVDFESMKAEQLGWKMDTYDAYHSLLAKVKTNGIPDGVKEKAEKTWNDREFCREAFATLEDYTLVVAVDNIDEDRKLPFMLTFQESADIHYKSREEYAAMFSARALTYAFVDTEGNWNQRGEMGWWGMDDKEKGTPDYDAAFWKFIESLAPEQRIYIVDCHI